jgi:hypothetical protein
MRSNTEQITENVNRLQKRKYSCIFSVIRFIIYIVVLYLITNKIEKCNLIFLLSSIRLLYIIAPVYIYQHS